MAHHGKVINNFGKFFKSSYQSQKKELNLIIGLKEILRALKPELNKILNLFDKFSYNIFVHVHLLN